MAITTKDQPTQAGALYQGGEFFGVAARFGSPPWLRRGGAQRRGGLDNRGTTLVELMTTLILSGIFVSMIFLSYTILQKQWILSQKKEEITTFAITANRALYKALSQAKAVQALHQGLWYLQADSGRQTLRFEDGRLLLGEKALAKNCNVAEFAIKSVSSQIGPPIVEYLITVAKADRRAAVQSRVALLAGSWTALTGSEPVSLDSLETKKMVWDSK